uniref:Uncharacterized protein n=1 Tax=Leersia perrieri TaxID=77586 RepID=A0A0D9VF75_9ORYZ
MWYRSSPSLAFTDGGEAVRTDLLAVAVETEEKTPSAELRGRDMGLRLRRLGDPHGCGLAERHRVRRTQMFSINLTLQSTAARRRRALGLNYGTQDLGNMLSLGVMFGRPGVMMRTEHRSVQNHNFFPRPSPTAGGYVGCLQRLSYVALHRCQIARDAAATAAAATTTKAYAHEHEDR